MFCVHCGASIPEGGAFCTNCGSKIEKQPAAEPVATPYAANAAPFANPVYIPEPVAAPYVADTAPFANPVSIPEPVAAPYGVVAAPYGADAAPLPGPVSIPNPVAAPYSAGAVPLPGPINIPKPPLANRLARGTLSALFGLLTFIFLLALFAFVTVRSVDIAEIVSKADLTQFLEETEAGDEIIATINELQQAGANVDVDILKDFLRRDNVASEIGNVAQRYIEAIADADFDYYMSSREIVRFLRAIAPDIYDEFDYRLTDEDYNAIAEALDTDVNLRDYRVGNILDDAGLSIEAPWVLLSVYPVIVFALLCALLVFDIFLLHRDGIGRAFLISGIPFILSGLLYTAAWLFIGPFSSLLSGSGFYGFIRMTAGFAGLLLMPGLICLGIGIVFLAAMIVIKKIWKQPRPKNPSKKSVKTGRIIGLAANIAVLVACLVLSLLCIAGMMEASENQSTASEFSDQTAINRV